MVTEQTDIPGAGNGVTIITGVPRRTILGLYLNHPNLPRVTKDRIYNPNNTSMYAVEFNGLYRDAYDPSTQTISSLVACFNDPLDMSRDNSEFFIHKDKAHLLTVRATKDIISGSFGFLPYGGPFWCNAAYPLDTLVRAVKRYCINIYASSTETTGDWKSLPLFDQLSSVFTPLRKTLCASTNSATCRFLLFPA